MNFGRLQQQINSDFKSNNLDEPFYETYHQEKAGENKKAYKQLFGLFCFGVHCCSLGDEGGASQVGVVFQHHLSTISKPIKFITEGPIIHIHK